MENSVRIEMNYYPGGSKWDESYQFINVDVDASGFDVVHWHRDKSAQGAEPTARMRLRFGDHSYRLLKALCERPDVVKALITGKPVIVPEEVKS